MQKDDGFTKFDGSQVLRRNYLLCIMMVTFYLSIAIAKVTNVKGSICVNVNHSYFQNAGFLDDFYFVFILLTFQTFYFLSFYNNQISVHYYFLYIILFIFVCARSSLLHGLFSSCAKQGLHASCRVQASHCGGFSCC